MRLISRNSQNVQIFLIICRVYLEATKKKSPFTSIACQKLITPLKEWANKNNFTLEPNTPLMKKRMNSVVAKTFHGAGILVPYNRQTNLGYRRLAEPDGETNT